MPSQTFRTNKRTEAQEWIVVAEQFATPSFVEHQARRGLSEEVLRLILWFGQELRGRGVRFLTVLERRLPPAYRGTEIARKARDWVVVVDDHERLRTCYRRAHAARVLKTRYATA